MSKIALITDSHWGARGDSLIFLSAFEKFYSEIFFPTLKERGINTIAHLGDIVERRKHINYNTLNAFKNQFVNRCIEDKIELNVLIGNHDIYYKNTNSINSMNELFGNINSEYLNYYSAPTEITIDKLPIIMIPWINQENYEETFNLIDKTKAEILFGHLDINGFELHKGHIQENGMDAKLFQKFDMVFSGHFHHKSQKGNIWYLGNTNQLTWSDYNDQRGFHIFDTETRTLEFIENPYKMFYKIIYNDLNKTKKEIVDKDFSGLTNTFVKVIIQDKTNPYYLDLMLDNLYSHTPAKVTIVDDNRNLDQMTDEEIIDSAEDTMTIMNKYIENIKVSVDPDKLKSIMHSLYREAQSLEF